MKIAWIGCGVMGKSMLLNLHKGGHTVSAYNRTYEKAEPLKEQGILVTRTIRERVKDAELVCTMVGYPSDVKEVYEGEDGIFAHAQHNAVLIDFTTSSPALAKTLAAVAKERGFAMLDAPVSGGDSGARDATLSIMAGGDADVFKRMLPVFSLLGKGIHYMGPAGSGQHTKACNQIAVAGAVAAMSEALVYARAVGLDEKKMLAAISGGAAGSWQITNTAPRVLNQDFAPGFYIKHFIKDMHIVQQEMEEQGVHLDMLEAVCNMYEALANAGEENNGTQALVHYYE